MFSRVLTFGVIAIAFTCPTILPCSYAQGPGTPPDTLSKLKQHDPESYPGRYVGGLPLPLTLKALVFLQNQGPTPPRLYPAIESSPTGAPLAQQPESQERESDINTVSRTSPITVSDLLRRKEGDPLDHFIGSGYDEENDPAEEPIPDLVSKERYIENVRGSGKIENFIERMGPWSPFHKYR